MTRHYRIPIRHAWQGDAAPEAEWASIEIALGADTFTVTADAPMHHDPAPEEPAGELEGLWNYEVAELFLFAVSNGLPNGRYLEIELGPHGHYLAWQFRAIRERCGSATPLRSEVCHSERSWRGVLELQTSDLPSHDQGTTSGILVNAFTMHGVGEVRRHLASRPVPGDAPDFHRPGCAGPLADYEISDSIGS